MARKAAAPKVTRPEWPAAHVEMWDIAQLAPYARNAKRHTDEQVNQIAASITEFGWTIPVLAAEDGTIIAGHGRVLAAQKLGITQVPVMVALGWSDAQRRAYTIADNKLTENGQWDEDLLRLELGELKEELDIDLGLTGFGEKELVAILDGWASDIGAVEKHGEHTDGITRTLKFTVAQKDAEEADRVIRAALQSARIEFEA